MSKHFIRSIFRSLISVLLAGMFFSSAIFSFALTIPSGVEIIEDNAFEGNSSLVEVTIPDSVRVLGSSVFEACPALRDIYITGSEISLGTNALGRSGDKRTLHADYGSIIQFYASSNGLDFEPFISPAVLLLEYAATQLGTSYSMHDCVTYARECYRVALGIKINASCVDVERNTKGIRIDSITDLKPGDILCWKNDTVSYCTHVGLYVGPGTVNGKKYSTGVFIESSRGAGKVRYNYIPATGTNYYTRNFMGAWRIL